MCFVINILQKRQKILNGWLKAKEREKQEEFLWAGRSHAM
jgi:hypothetical protein